MAFHNTAPTCEWGVGMHEVDMLYFGRCKAPKMATIDIDCLKDLYSSLSRCSWKITYFLQPLRSPRRLRPRKNITVHTRRLILCCLRHLCIEIALGDGARKLSGAILVLTLSQLSDMTYLDEHHTSIVSSLFCLYVHVLTSSVGFS